jgi:hypothetical protein
VITGRQFCDWFEFSTDALQEFLAGIRHRAAGGHA